MFHISKSEEPLIVALVWLVWYGWAFHKAVRLQSKSDHEAPQLLFSDILAATPGLLLVFYLTISQFTNAKKFDLPPYMGGLLILSQFAGIYFSILQLSRIPQSLCSDPAYRALRVFFNTVLNALCCALILLFAVLLIHGDCCLALPISIFIMYLSKGIVEDISY